MTAQTADSCDVTAALKAQGRIFLQILSDLTIAILPFVFIGGLVLLAWKGGSIGEFIAQAIFGAIVFGFLGGMVLWGLGWLLYRLFQPAIDVALCLLRQKRRAKTELSR